MDLIFLWFTSLSYISLVLTVEAIKIMFLVILASVILFLVLVVLLSAGLIVVFSFMIICDAWRQDHLQSTKYKRKKK